ncbi:MAG: acetyl-CoA carboxylase biotin carboxyl carrier protein [Synechococcales cyanobacterium T60_A2020_003]|nr:acetyl-CoA carboxylase biotin carboxyl carrier protein [Synechococcales cyanobacterium T60_A2020_003]
MKFDFEELRELLTVLNQTDVAELTLKSDDFELTLRKGTWVAESTPAQLPISKPGSAAAPPSYPAMPSAAPSDAIAPTSPPPAASSGSTAPSSAPPSSETKYLEIHSPMVGTFYRAPAPDEPAYVNVGDRIQIGQTVCIIEAMKLMNELEAEVSGEIIEILVQNAEPVEYGQVLMRVKPN